MPGISSLLKSGSGGGSSLGLNVLLIAGGGVLILSGIKNVSLVDAALGRVPSGTSDGTGAMAGASLGAPLAGTASGGIVVMDGHRVAAWIADDLQWARAHGWRGRVTSGVRTDAEQMSAASSYGLSHYPSGPLASNHVERNGVNYPHGAVDVTEPAQLNAVLKLKPGGSRLVWGGPVMGDEPHFSADGH